MSRIRIPLALMAALIFCMQQARAADDQEPFVLGPVMINFSERVELHSNAPLADGTYGDNTYLLSTFVMSRVIGKNVTGMLTFTNKYGMDEKTALTNISTVALIRGIGRRINSTLSYTNVSNPKATIAGLERPSSSSDWFALSSEIIVFSDKEQSIKTGVTFTTGTGFDSGQMLAGRIAWRTKLGQKTDCDLSYQAVYGLRDDPDNGEYNDLYANQYQFALGYKVNKLTKLQLAYLYLENRYPGNPGDNNILRLNAYRMLKVR